MKLVKAAGVCPPALLRERLPAHAGNEQAPKPECVVHEAVKVAREGRAEAEPNRVPAGAW